MSGERVYVASDVHLGSASDDRERAFCRWLRHAASDAREVVVNGDLFDFWFEYGSVVPRGHTRILGALAEVVDSGVQVRMVGGNHDWWGGSYLTNEVGVIFHHEPVRVTLAGQRTLLAHGDGLGQGDLGYRILQRAIRHPVICGLFRWLHPDVGGAVARTASRTELRNEGPDPRQLARARKLEEWAMAQLREEVDLDLVLLGHTHLPVVKELGGKFYVNSGDWIQHRSYVVLDPGAPPRLEHWI